MDKFQEISGLPNFSSKVSLTTEMLWAYLETRFPAHFVQQFERVIQFSRFGDYGDFCMLLDKLVNMSHRSATALIFDCYDYNQDGFICFQDAFKIIKERTHDGYDEDIVGIQH
jgi:Ca2+-binding EF-hand superfamily protein